MNQSMFPDAFQPRRPAKILFQDAASIEFLWDDLRQMGITNFATAESALIESVERFRMGASLMGHPTLASRVITSNPMDTQYE